MIFNIDYQYLNLLEDILLYGEKKEDRTGTGTISLFGPQIECDLQKGFPLLTTKKLHFNSIVVELLWFIKGMTNISSLNENGVKIWNDDAYRWYKQQYPYSTLTKEEFIETVMTVEGNTLGDLGPIYGKQWRKWNTGRVEYQGDDEYPRPVLIDQLSEAIHQIKTNPDSRRIIVSAWNPGDLHKMALPPCHILFQFYVSNGYLSLKMYQRSADVFLGVPFNIASYALLVHLICSMPGVNLKPGRLILTFGDAHIYSNHVEQVKEQLNRVPKVLPSINIKNVHDRIEYYTVGDIELLDYSPHPLIKGKLSVGV